MLVMSFEDDRCSSSSSSSFSSNEDRLLASPAQAPWNVHTNNCSSTPTPAPSQQATPHKRRAGRKKFRETRHPVYRGVRERNGGKWVCEVREPHKKTRIWLGTYQIPEMAARAHDVAAIALRGKSAQLNFADSAWILPRATSSSAEDIRTAAAQAAVMFRPSSPSTPTRKLERKHQPHPQQQQHQKQKRHVESAKTSAPPPAAAAPPYVNVTAEADGFVDEEALFNMPALLQSMAEGLLLTPPPMQQEIDWDDVDCHMDLAQDLGLWNADS